MSVIRIILASGLMALPTAAEQDVIDLQQIAQKIKDYRKSLFEQEGGLEFTSTLSAVKDPNEEFAFRDSLSIKTVILWPKLFISGTGQLRDQPEPGTRVSVYDFVKHQTKGYDNQGGVIYPGRHLFSGGYSLMFKYLHFAEGYQQYEFGKETAGLTSVPECFASSKYRVAGKETLDGVNCVVVESEGRDKIWLAVEKGYLVHRRERELRYGDAPALREMTTIVKYQDACPSLPLPQQIDVNQHYGPDDKPERRGKLKVALRLYVDLVECGKVDPALMEVNFPDGLPVNDLTQD